MQITVGKMEMTTQDMHAGKLLVFNNWTTPLSMYILLFQRFERPLFCGVGSNGDPLSKDACMGQSLWVPLLPATAPLLSSTHECISDHSLPAWCIRNYDETLIFAITVNDICTVAFTNSNTHFSEKKTRFFLCSDYDLLSLKYSTLLASDLGLEGGGAKRYACSPTPCPYEVCPHRRRKRGGGTGGTCPLNFQSGGQGYLFAPPPPKKKFLSKKWRII